MKSARLERLGSPLVIRDMPEPEIRPGSVIVRMLAARVISYAREVFAGRQGFTLPPPFTPGPGGVGIVERVADDVEGIAVGERVWLGSYLPGADDGWLLLGWTGTSEALRRAWPDGSYAERAVWPAASVTPLRGLDDVDPVLLTELGKLVVSYGGLIAGGVRPGDVVAVNGANGGFGAAGVVMAVALGAARVLAIGRDARGLEQLRAACGDVVVPVALTADEAADVAAIRDASAGGPHVALDFLGQTRDPGSTRACLRGLRRRGTAVFMGGVDADVPVPYREVMLRDLTVRGAFMHPPDAPASLVRLAAAGRIPLDRYRPRTFPLAQAAEAVEHASSDKGLALTAITMP